MKTVANKIIMGAQELSGALTAQDESDLREMSATYEQAMAIFARIEAATGGAPPESTAGGSPPASATGGPSKKPAAPNAAQAVASIPTDLHDELVAIFNLMGKRLHHIVAKEPRINVYSFQRPREIHGEASRLIAKLRNIDTVNSEFLYYTQRAYELLFQFAHTEPLPESKNHLIVKTPVAQPVRNYAVHKIPNIDAAIGNSVMCVLLRGALLPSMIMSKEFQEYSSKAAVTPFALFRIKRDDSKTESSMDYVLDLDRSFFRIEDLQGKDLCFADPMNATGGSLVTIMRFLRAQGVVPRSVRVFNIISALKGALQVCRAVPEAQIYTLWMDPVLNEDAYIMPGLGDAGDRLNGRDVHDEPRNLIQLIADYGNHVTDLYRSQVRAIESLVLAR